MAWDSGKSVNGRLVYSETITLGSTATVNGSTIDFVPQDEDFQVFINTGATNTTGAVTADLECSWDGTTWVDLNATFGSDCDTAVVHVAYVNATTGDFPYWRLSYDSAGAATGELIVVKVVV